MKMNNVLAKTGLALAISAFTAGAAFAGTHTVTPASGIVLANEIFGAGSQDTLVAIPLSTYDVAYEGTEVGGALVAGDVVTIKFTLDKGAVFGEDLSDIQKWADSNATLAFNFGNGVAGAGAAIQTEVVGGEGAGYTPAFAESIVVDQGGAIGDNTVTFKIDTTGLDSAKDISVKFGQVRVKNLTSALQRDNGLGPVSLGAEFRNLTKDQTDTQPAVVVLSSQNGVELIGTATDYSTNGARARINVANTELKFTGSAGAAASNDFNADQSVTTLNLGTLRVVRTKHDGSEKVDKSKWADSTAKFVTKENGDDFDFQGSDKPVVTLTSSSVLTAYSSIYLNAAGTACGAGAPVKAVTPVAGAESVSIDLGGQTTTQLQAGYNVCAVAGNAVAIPESSFEAQLNVTYFNPRYTDSADTLSYGQVLRNGCQVTLFNLPNVNAADKAMVRLTNVSDNPGSVRGYVWTEDGRQIDAGALLTDKLGAHATTVFHTNPSLNSGVYLGDVMAEFAGETTGRHRLVLQGAFPACEALGMVRSPNGTLVNMTSTTSSGSDAFLGSDRSNTSNTSN